MRNTITRTITESTICAVKVEIIDGKPEMCGVDPITVNGKITTEKATKLLQKKYGKGCPVAVTSITENDVLYEISVDDFMKYAKRVDD